MRTHRFGWLVLALVLAACGDDGGTDDAGVDGSTMDAARPCESDAECDDGLYCTGIDRCVDGFCAVEPVCPSGEACDESERRCIATCANPDADGDGVSSVLCGGTDCDDTDPRRYPGAVEICDPAGVDEDCDPTTHGRRDVDRDGVDDARCRNVVGTEVSTVGEDCDDTRRGVNPDAPEVCNGLDDDCDGAIDEEVTVSGYADLDGDGRGDVSAPMRACPSTARFALEAGDCDDTNPLVNDIAPELCDGIDNDCDGRIDEGTIEVEWYVDADGDGWGVRGPSIRSCTPIEGRSMFPLDCADDDPLRHPGAVERCNGLDDDCNGLRDFALGRNDWEDDDDDGFPDAACGAEIAEPDCDDGDPAMNPRAGERCGNHLDDDCDGMVDEGCGAPRDGGMPMRDGGGSSSCDADLATDPDNCGECGFRCVARPHSEPMCDEGLCTLSCEPDRADCNNIEVDGCETRITDDPWNCGGCGVRCGADQTCVGRSCVRGTFRSSGVDGAFDPEADVVLPAGTYNFTTIRVRPGVTVRVDGSGVLDLRATGDVVIEGVVDVSGGAGAPGVTSGSAALSRNGGGGATGWAIPAESGQCAPGGTGGIGPSGTSASTTSSCGLGGQAGGGAGGYQYICGGGGGGPAGGGGGGGSSCSGGAGGGAEGGAGGAQTPALSWPGRGGGRSLPSGYAGADGALAERAESGGGGGGSIGSAAVADLAVSSTFVPGSSGGGGGFGHFSNSLVGGGGGGGGGGGAVRIASPTRIEVRPGGAVLANGGRGGAGGQHVSGGGGGSGGVVYLAAPTLVVRGTVSAQGGPGGGGGAPSPPGSAGGAGGLGRVRFSVNPASCELAGSIQPAPPMGCQPVGAVPGRAYVGLFPN